MLWDKLKIAKGDKKKIFYMLILGTAAIILLIAAEFFDNTPNDSSKSQTPVTNTENIGDIEGELSAVLGKIEGVGKVSVAVEYDSSGKKEYAYNEEVSESTSGGEGDVETQTTTRREMVLLNGDDQGVLITDTPGEIVGVLVVAQGANSAIVREKIQNAVTTCLNVGADKVAVYPMEG